jgi:hypothetical protein
MSIHGFGVEATDPAVLTRVDSGGANICGASGQTGAAQANNMEAANV